MSITADADLISCNACPSLQIVKTVNISIFSAIFMIPISMVVPWMFQVRDQAIHFLANCRMLWCPSKRVPCPKYHTFNAQAKHLTYKSYGPKYLLTQYDSPQTTPRWPKRSRPSRCWRGSESSTSTSSSGSDSTTNSKRSYLISMYVQLR